MLAEVDLHSGIGVFGEEAEGRDGVGFIDEVEQIFQFEERQGLVDKESVVGHVGDEVEI